MIGRRGLLGGVAAAMTSRTGRIIQRPDQIIEPPPSAVPASTAAGTLRARQVVIFGTGVNVGLFVYTGTPASGNPPQIAIVPSTTTTDPFGNAITSSNILMQANVITETGGTFRTAAVSPLIQIDGPHDAILLYNAAAQLVLSGAPVATNDGFGTAVPAGWVSYSAGTPTTNAALTAAGLNFNFSAATAPAQLANLSTVLTLVSGTTAGQTSATLTVSSGSPGFVGVGTVAFLIGEQATPAAQSLAANGSSLFTSNASGMLRFVADTVKGDGNAFDTGRGTVYATAIPQSITSTTPATLTGLTRSLAIGTYRIRAWLVATAAAAAGQMVVRLAASGGLVIGTSEISCVCSGAATVPFVSHQTALGTNLSSQAMTNGNNYVFDIRAKLVVTTAGTLVMQGLEGTAGDAWTLTDGEMNVYPVG